VSAIGLEAIREHRGMGDSWPKAIRSSWEPKAWFGVRVQCLGAALAHAGIRLQGMCDYQD
jgi:hypothetical protein